MKPWMRPRAWPLWSKVAALLLLGAVLPLFLLGALILQRERREARATNVALLEARVDEIGHTLEAMYLGYLRAAAQTAQYPELVEFLRAPAEARDGAHPALQIHLELLRGDDPNVRGAGVADLQGPVIAATEAPLLGASIAYRGYFQAAARGEEGISDVYLSVPATGRVPSVAFAAPVRSPGGPVIGVFVLWLRAEALWDVLRRANGTAGRGSFFALFDRHGIRVAHGANERLLFHPSVPLADEAVRAMIAERRFQERTAELLAAVVPFPFHEIQGRERRIFRRPTSPTNHLPNLAVSRRFARLGGTLVAHIPEREVDVGVLSLLPRFLPAIAVGLGWVLVGGALLLRIVVSPIRRVANAAAALEHGQLEERWEPEPADAARSDDVGRLARTFRSMAAALADRERSLRDRNRELERHHRALVMLTRCDEALVRAADERSLLDAVCGTIVREGGYRMCWVGWAEHDGRKTVHPAAHAGYEDGYLASLDLVWADTDRGRGPGGIAIRTGRPVIARDVASDPSMETWRDEARAHGFRSLAALPLAAEGGPALGLLAIYSEREDAFDEPEVRLLCELAADLAYGVAALRGREERLRMTAHLVQAERLVSVGTLAAGVAHEINNPLAYVVAALQFVEEELDVLRAELPRDRLESIGEALSDARDGAARVTTIVRDLKTFARADEERRGQVDLHEVLDSSIHMAMNEIRHRARLVKDYRPVPPLLGNEARLGQVFLNLLVNAAQAIREGAADANEIRVSTWTDEAGRAIVEVRDTGAGIAPDVRGRIFDPFFTTKPVGVGMGLGLFVCRNVVAAAGGEISVESEPGKGAAFRVRLPAEARARGDAPAPGPAPPPRERRGGRVLVVDDEPAVGKAIRRMLRGEHDVVVLTSAAEARDRIAGGERYDVILCDLMMPVMTGMDLHAELGVLAPEQAARMVLLTGGAFTSRARRFLEECPNPRLEKPLDAAELRAFVSTRVQ